jgi:hypothetical protein
VAANISFVRQVAGAQMRDRIFGGVGPSVDSINTSSFVVRIGVSGSATISTRHNTPWALAGDIDNRRPGSGVGRNGLVS